MSSLDSTPEEGFQNGPDQDRLSTTNPYAAPQSSDHEQVTAKALLADELVSILDQTRSAILSVARTFTLLAVLIGCLAPLMFWGAGSFGTAALLLVLTIAVAVLAGFLYGFAGRIEAFVATREVSELLQALIYQRRFWRYLSVLLLAMVIVIAGLVSVLLLA